MKTKLRPAGATTATAHKIEIIFYLNYAQDQRPSSDSARLLRPVIE